MFLRQALSHARFSPDKMGKADLLRGEQLFAGLNCFEPGQQHEPHAHPGQDKLYYVLEGSGLVEVGGQAEELSAGDAALAPAGVLHSIRNTGPGRLVVMAVLAPPPGKK
jgi:quercetin dioxygenase-like cupin family protein